MGYGKFYLWSREYYENFEGNAKKGKLGMLALHAEHGQLCPCCLCGMGNFHSYLQLQSVTAFLVRNGKYVEIVTHSLNRSLLSGGENWGDGRRFAARWNRPDMVAFMVKGGATQLQGAAEAGSPSMVRWGIEKWAKNWSCGLCSAAMESQHALMAHMVQRG